MSGSGSCRGRRAAPAIIASTARERSAASPSSAARALGFSLDQVRALLGLADDRRNDCAGIDRIADEHLREVERKIADLIALRRELKAVIESCGGGTVADCRIIEALAP